MLATPYIVVIDSSSLGNAARDYWSSDANLRLKSRTFLQELQIRGVYVALTKTQVFELIRHENESDVRERLSFLRVMPLIAWLRPYDRKWFPGDHTDLMTRELHAYVHGGANSWIEIVQEVRSDLWESGTGGEMFVDDDALWGTWRQMAMQQHQDQRYIASVARTDPGGVSKCKLNVRGPTGKLSPEDKQRFQNRFAARMTEQLLKHGDKGLPSAREAAEEFTRETIHTIDKFDAQEDPILAMCEKYNVPPALVHPKMTVEEFGALGVYAEKLRIVAARLNPPCELDIESIPIQTLPSHVLETRLRTQQQKADRVKGSDLGDGHLAALTFYADAVQVDKRTWGHLNQIKREKSLGSFIGRYFRDADYSRIPQQFT